MGLDMYLYSGSPDKVETEDYCIDTSPLGEELAYWRKAYEIDSWFVKHCKCVEDDYLYEVTREDLKNLIFTLTKVFLSEDPQVAHRYLPYKEEFKEINYDWYYFDSLQSTITKLTRILCSNSGKIFTYLASR